MSIQKEFYAYIRVSTAKQGEKGVSLQEQKDAITRYAERNTYTIIEWFEERETAASRGRPVFNQMLRLLRKRRVRGVLIHKIDRSARNLKDWADLGELIDEGVEVHFANEGLDLLSRGGRLSADIQAVVAADYIRNLREETIKGLYGRLKQGIYPFAAPIGYLNHGGGKPKTIDSERGPLIRELFELYATGKYPIRRIREEMTRRGLRNASGGKVSLNSVSIILSNPFYTGLIRIRKNSQVFQGVHEPLIPMALFQKVEAVRTGNQQVRTTKHAYCFRKFIRCKLCGMALMGELQKRRIYYRCQTKGCPTKTIREDRIDRAAIEFLARLELPDDILEKIISLTRESKRISDHTKAEEQNLLTLKLGHIKDRLNRLTDAYLDRLIEETSYRERQESAMRERQEIENRLTDLNAGKDVAAERLERYLRIAGNLAAVYTASPFDEKRGLLELLTSNRTLNERKLELEPVFTFMDTGQNMSVPCGGR